MRIESIEARAVLVPLTTPAAFSTRRITGREYVIVRVVEEGGTSGVGYTYAGDSGGLWLQAGIEQLLARRLRGRSVFAIDESWDWVFRDLLLLGRRGAVLSMLSAVEIALWDLVARRAGVPLPYLLGGPGDTVSAYASGGYYRLGDPCDNVEAQLARYCELGFTDSLLRRRTASRSSTSPLRRDLQLRAARRQPAHDRKRPDQGSIHHQGSSWSSTGMSSAGTPSPRQARRRGTHTATVIPPAN
jgi:L-alanine-DL-glutamate epimerase-like enolase superfamily enzyme